MALPLSLPLPLPLPLPRPLHHSSTTVCLLKNLKLDYLKDAKIDIRFLSKTQFSSYESNNHDKTMIFRMWKTSLEKREFNVIVKLAFGDMFN